MFYTLKSNPKKKHIYNILLNNLLQIGDPEEITKIIYYEHNKILDPDIIAPEQVASMVSRLIEYYM